MDGHYRQSTEILRPGFCDGIIGLIALFSALFQKLTILPGAVFNLPERLQTRIFKLNILQ